MERMSEKVFLEFTVSIRRNKIDVQWMLMYPTVFLLREEIECKSMGNASEREIIEAFPAFINILNFSSKRNAYYRFFNAKNDINLVKEGIISYILEKEEKISHLGLNHWATK